MIPSPTTYTRLARTRAGVPVRFGKMPQPVAEFVYEGRLASGELHLWQPDGAWRLVEDARGEHPLDLLFTAELSCGR
ncbi:MAG TPA: hypothetical protein VK477_11130 [Acidobacteriota bacterium]|nr:hypothetical protein [Acidobacteriota bacterium]